MNSPRVAVLMHNLGGGLETVVLNQVRGLTHYPYEIDLVLDRADGLDAAKIPPKVRIIDLKTPISPNFKSALALIPPLIRYLRQEKPIALFSHLIFVNVVTAIARTLARFPTHLTLIEHNLLFQKPGRSNEPSSKLLPLLMRGLYPKADRVVAVSKDMASTLEQWLHFPSGKIDVIYNPALDRDFAAKAKAPLEHPWFAPSAPPVFLGVGRLEKAKDFPTLLRAFARLRQQREAKLILLGEGKERPALETSIEQLGLESEVSLPGFTPNPYAYMSRARACVLSSRWEGLPTVLIEALACGCQVVATDCPYGPREILDSGKYGRLVPVEDVEALAEAMQLAIDRPLDTELLERRALDFGIDRAVTQYLDAIESDLLPKSGFKASLTSAFRQAQSTTQS
ncbi:glycosyltransferase [Oscillatoria sp. FACHB-1406]|uniref:glycosyltransferase n=1 Tax=Oscillatoria sp. FACHB-1406 TaxID=2692846 RepID=UPI001688FD9E|nr:glycosyltransferase [Oscillatoria sp. FACHB-1406]MBD2577594.1 glycosyltransferase [Oscillatoria sp. FACHB-1406]